MDETFKISALKYRPQTFDQVIGQDSVTSTLQNAITKEEVPQALLFCGPRGVGKTTCARILAKKINQSKENSSDEDFFYNIFELDAASNNGVDGIRDLNEQVRIPPQKGKFKVYIIDEVHMLSTAAFNAFLKTLEEPPKHAVFILATTQKNKIIPTILSRCQIYDFKRMTISNILDQLKYIASKKEIKYEEDALIIIAQKADGAMRDALSIFDRMVSFTNGNLTTNNVSKNLNVLDFEIYFKIVNHIKNKEIPQVIIELDRIINLGYENVDFLSGLALHIRKLILCKNLNTIDLIEFGPKLKNKFVENSELFETNYLIKALSIINETELNLKNSINKRLQTELCLMKLASIESIEKKKIIIPSSYYKKEKKLKLESFKDHKEYQINKNLNYSSFDKIDNNKLSGVSNFSLKSINFKKEIKKNETKLGAKKNLEVKFTKKELLLYWKEYKKKIEKTGNYNMLAILEMDEPRLKINNLIEFNVANSFNKIELEGEIDEILPFLRNKLKNDKINIAVKIKEMKNEAVFTLKEKFEKMKNYNPAISLLKKTFDLDI
tara:strand:+ start:17922 stop:19577 length:1656 start_codon:yes stop_codon:yes gene_type:complete